MTLCECEHNYDRNQPIKKDTVTIKASAAGSTTLVYMYSKRTTSVVILKGNMSDLFISYIYQLFIKYFNIK